MSISKQDRTKREITARLALLQAQLDKTRRLSLLAVRANNPFTLAKLTSQAAKLN